MRVTRPVVSFAAGRGPVRSSSFAADARRPVATAYAWGVPDGRRLPSRRTPLRHGPHPEERSRVCTTLVPVLPFRPRSWTWGRAPGPPPEQRQWPHCAPGPGSHPTPQ